MKNRVHTVLCWILAVSLVWLPLSVSAGISLSSTEKNACHEMNLTMSGHKMNSAMSGQVTVIDNSMHKSMMRKGCCGHCGNNCAACTSNLSCGQNVHHVSPFIIITQYFFKSLQTSQFPIEYFVQYHSQITTPDIRPPLV